MTTAILSIFGSLLSLAIIGAIITHLTSADREAAAKTSGRIFIICLSTAVVLSLALPLYIKFLSSTDAPITTSSPVSPKPPVAEPPPKLNAANYLNYTLQNSRGEVVGKIVDYAGYDDVTVAWVIGGSDRLPLKRIIMDYKYVAP